ncbi:ribosomal protein S18 acetylase RimI-like enzyme [Breznakia sp. PF5-3]|uniref:GNAT family N-acetyltransferase n=1 Tax=unclassified Breznakia TaxID=2623764 RepID=UPI002406D50C|nr:MULTISPECIES: GNAT family N-acetyltransferase [unclassified Breznakia]MDF9825508.1 ribosomal protein S18 acetylase RimI-like enzyme [Breznakia sp. PM6-1]MDF9836370.1 ribosomal protein S18 acetylase RimI-like enzyme [Breznakia sp. PF5-3]MDF9837486.1 ribosomal protein S18 acetylase RimI-like enzyme [Breznakia sp. PFB2-8]MDF9859451.1 ribosomal protein S18 acetylase RimI-like enzyme [Breznakia sp. PH5-24]
MLNKDLPYCDIIMKADAKVATNHKILTLPEGYSYKMYEDGDEEHWIEIEYSVHEFESKEKARDYFNRVFMPYKDTLPKRMCFILDENKNYVATSSAWFKNSKERYYAVLHWVSTSPSAQGKGLGRAIVTYALSKFKETDPEEKEIFLHTQTWSYKAVGLYGKLGFKITELPLLDSATDPKAYEVLKKVMHPKHYELII